MTGHNQNNLQKARDDVIKAKTSVKLDDELKAAFEDAKKQEADAKKKHADAEAGFITFVVSSAGLVSKCRIPTAAAQRGLFRILLESGASVTDMTKVIEKAGATDMMQAQEIWSQEMQQTRIKDVDAVTEELFI